MHICVRNLPNHLMILQPKNQLPPSHFVFSLQTLLQAGFIGYILNLLKICTYIIMHLCMALYQAL